MPHLWIKNFREVFPEPFEAAFRNVRARMPALRPQICDYERVQSSPQDPRKEILTL